MKRFTVFAKGNLDVRDTLHSLRVGGSLVWNGINEIVRARHPEISVRVRHEVYTRSDALLAARGQIPEGLIERDLPLGPFPLRTQFDTAIFSTDADAIVLSVQPDVLTNMVVNRREGYLFYPYGRRTMWRPGDLAWLHEAFAPAPMLDVETSMRNIEAVVERIRTRSEAPVLIYNLSSVIPGEFVHSYQGLDEILSTRIRRFNLGLVDLSQRTGLSIVDVDAVVARIGTERTKIDMVHYNAEGCRAIAEEVVRVLDDLGCF